MQWTVNFEGRITLFLTVLQESGTWWAYKYFSVLTIRLEDRCSDTVRGTGDTERGNTDTVTALVIPKFGSMQGRRKRQE